MPNNSSTKKALRSAEKKRLHNLLWKRRFKSAAKSVSKAIVSKDDATVLSEKLTALQKTLDKASKEKVIHKNKANRLKSRYAKKVSAQSEQTAKSVSKKTK